MNSVRELVDRFEAVIINPALLLLFTAGFFLFVWGLIVFLFKLDEKTGRETGKMHMRWGLVGMFIIVSVYGILALISNTFNLGYNPQTKSYNPDMNRIEDIAKPLFEGKFK